MGSKDISKAILEYFKRSISRLREINLRLDPNRESMLTMSRELYLVVRNGFKELYRGNFELSKKYLERSNEVVKSIYKVIESSDLYIDLSKIAYDPLREYVELILLYSTLTGDDKYIKFLNVIKPEIVLDGYIDYAGELHRMAVSKLIDDDCEGALKYISILENIYIDLLSNPLDNYVYRDYKRKVDKIRAILDKVKSDYLYRCSRR